MSDDVKYICETIKTIASAAREAGVAHVNVHVTSIGAVDITMAPPPVVALAPAPVRAVGSPGPASQLASFHAKQAQAQHKHDTMFAATSVKPKFTSPEPPPSVVPRAVRDRKAATRGDNEEAG